MVGENGVPHTPDWDISRVLTPTTNEAIRLPLLYDGDQA